MFILHTFWFILVFHLLYFMFLLFSYSFIMDDDLTLLWSSFHQDSHQAASGRPPPLLWRTNIVNGLFESMEAFITTAIFMDCHLVYLESSCSPADINFISLPFKELSSTNYVTHQLDQGIPTKKRNRTSRFKNEDL